MPSTCPSVDYSTTSSLTLFSSTSPCCTFLSPTTMSDNESTIYQQRVSTGAYARLMDNIKAIKSRALVFSEYKRDFYQDSKRGFMTHRSDGDPTPFKMWLFGEIASRAVGTLHQASGNHYLGKRPVRTPRVACNHCWTFFDIPHH